MRTGSRAKSLRPSRRLSATRFTAQLEEQLRDLPATYQSSDLHHRLRSFGYTAFKFLSALDRGRLTPLGLRRLQEYQRKFDRDLPEPPTGVITYTVGSPIGGPATGKMSNAQWLQAMAKHDNDDRDFGSEVGGARELAQQLKARTAEDPLRFAGLAMQLTPETNEAYSGAILVGLRRSIDSRGSAARRLRRDPTCHEPRPTMTVTAGLAGPSGTSMTRHLWTSSRWSSTGRCTLLTLSTTRPYSYAKTITNPDVTCSRTATTPHEEAWQSRSATS